MAPDAEAAILAKALGSLGGPGARWVSRLLPKVDHEVRLEVEPTEGLQDRVGAVLAGMGSPIPELQSGMDPGTTSCVLAGSGSLRLNPTIVYVRIEPGTGGCVLTVRAVAKEGLVKQHSARKAVEHFERELRASLG